MSEYKRNPRGARRARKSMSRKAIVVLSLALVLVLAAVGGTVAWLADSTEPVTNTFTIGNIDITLVETKEDFKMVPGAKIQKDPKVTVKADSEPCWVFVHVQESTDPKLTDYITYTVDANWTLLGDGVYYREVSASTADQTFSVLTGDQVTVNKTVTKTMMDGLTTSGKKPTLTFKAYAIQKEGFATANDAWKQITTETFNTTTGANE